MSNRNRTAGHNFERKIVNELKEKYPNIVTARSESRNKDNLGIDIFDPENEMFFDIQCKVTKGLSSSKIKELLEAGDKNPMVVFHKFVKKANSKFITQGEYVYLDKKLFYELLWKLEKK